ncbi:winged helix-turn-helix domain-containing protein [Shewanella sp. KX20019]|uniref:winged helix-turn-helix domain-containing protein n=1 Tax=Shewanella sp. KX20019 TaxID=2803864 RepID=UPI00192608F4|nr:winged helix-turn-helix domain-containing protein [Shewanella sp. KX20019]QQX79914.1 winged helix-turn-helix domain-containing protein [Shewanella sp. KX20019]
MVGDKLVSDIMCDLYDEYLSCRLCPKFNGLVETVGIHKESANKLVNDSSRLLVSDNVIRLLCILLKNEAKVISKSDIIYYVWPDQVVGVNSLPVLIHQARTLIKGSHCELITIRCKGYAIKMIS